MDPDDVGAVLRVLVGRDPLFDFAWRTAVVTRGGDRLTEVTVETVQHPLPPPPSVTSRSSPAPASTTAAGPSSVAVRTS
jgi:hypothetical protein